MYKNIAALILIIYALFGGGLIDQLKNIVPKPSPEPNQLRY